MKCLSYSRRPPESMPLKMILSKQVNVICGWRLNSSEHRRPRGDRELSLALCPSHSLC